MAQAKPGNGSAPDHSPRATYREAGEAMRLATSRLHSVPRSPKTALWREIVWTVIVQVGSYSRLSDRVPRQHIADELGVAPKTVSRAMQWAAENAVIDWRPGRPGEAWVAVLPQAPEPPYEEPLDTSTEETVHTPLDTSIEETVHTPLDTSHRDLSIPPGHFTQGSVHHREDSEKISEKKPPPPDERAGDLSGGGGEEFETEEESENWAIAARGIYEIANDVGLRWPTWGTSGDLTRSDIARLVDQAERVDPTIRFDVMVRASSWGPVPGPIGSPYAIVTSRIDSALRDVLDEQATTARRTG